MDTQAPISIAHIRNFTSNKMLSRFLFLNSEISSEYFFDVLTPKTMSSKDGPWQVSYVKHGKLWRQCHISGYVSLHQLRKKDNQSFSLEN
jgi:hypothetical protein